MYLCFANHTFSFSYLPHPWVLLHFGHGSEQAWRGRGRRHLQDAAEVGGVDGGLLRVEQRGLVLLPLGGEVQLLSCPAKRNKNALRGLKLNLEKPPFHIVHTEANLLVFFVAQVMFFSQRGTQPRALIRVCCGAFRNPTLKL